MNCNTLSKNYMISIKDWEEMLRKVILIYNDLAKKGKKSKEFDVIKDIVIEKIFLVSKLQD